MRAHKEKYHFFVDVDKCSLCGKVSVWPSIVKGCIHTWKGDLTDARVAGGEVPGEPPLPSPGRPGGQGEQDGLSEVAPPSGQTH